MNISTSRLQGRSVKQFQDDLATAISGEEQLMQILQEKYGIQFKRTACGESGELIDDTRVNLNPDYQIKLPNQDRWYWLELKEVYFNSPFLTFKVHQLEHYVSLNAIVLVAYNTQRKELGYFSKDTQIGILYPTVLMRLLNEEPHSYFKCFPGVLSVRIYQSEFAKYIRFKPLFGV